MRIALPVVIAVPLFAVLGLCVSADVADVANITDITDVGDIDNGSIKGINCRGSSYCHDTHAIEQLIEYTSTLTDNQIFYDNDHIACDHSRTRFTCAWLNHLPRRHKVAGYITGTQVNVMLRHLRTHGCNGCGSIGVDYYDGYSNGPRVNDFLNGWLTVNIVKKHNCPGMDNHDGPGGLCDPVHPT